jgi:DNA gyrase subunit B
LLLTFFYRQMPEIIEGGHLFIAQPPLYKATRGRSEVYLKDEAALEEYLVAAGVASSSLDGVGSGTALRALVDHARRMRSLMRFVPRRYDPSIIEALAMDGVFDPEASIAQRAARLQATTVKLDGGDPEATWTAQVTDEGSLHFQRLWRGVTDHHVIEAAFLSSAEARKLHGLAAEQIDSFASAVKLVPIKAAAASDEPVESDEDEDLPVTVGKGEALIARPSQLLEAILAAGRKGLSIQRYKGLGEMNPEQLWETTLDPTNRSMLRVAVDQADVADEIFTRLMGDVVEPRREFIQENALSVANLDV